LSVAICPYLRLLNPCLTMLPDCTVSVDTETLVILVIPT
jgi:hypothetical protein